MYFQSFSFKTFHIKKCISKEYKVYWGYVSLIILSEFSGIINFLVPLKSKENL